MTESKPPKVPSARDSEGRMLTKKSISKESKDAQKVNELSPESVNNKPITSPLNINELIEITLSVPKTIIDIQVNLDNLPNDQKVTGAEILQILSNPDFDVTDKFKSDSISAENLDRVLTETQNLSLALTAFSNHRNQKALRIIKSKSLTTLIDFERFRKLSIKSY